MPLYGALGAYGSAAFSCANNICVGSYTDVSTVFRRLQTLINQNAARLGIGAPLAVDGKIGPATVERLYLVATSMPPRPDLVRLSGMGSLSPATLAANAAEYVEELEALLSGELQFPAEPVYGGGGPRPSSYGPSPGTTPSRPVQTPGVPGAGPHITDYATPGFSQLPTGARVGLAVAAVGILGVALYKVRKSRQTSSAPVAGWFRRRRRR